MVFRKKYPQLRFNCYQDLVDNYWVLEKSGPKEAHRLWWFAPTMAHIMVYEFDRHFIDKRNRKQHVFEYKCIFDPTGNRHGSLHTISTDEPFSAKKIIFKVLGYRTPRYYFAHYDPEIYKEQMKKYKAGKIRSRPNGRKSCLIKTAYPRLGPIDPSKVIL